MLHYRIEGEGETIVFLHGFMESMSMWEYLSLQELKFQKVFIDLPGHGNSELNADFGAPSMQYYLNEVMRVINHLKIKKFSVIGHSMGGYVALLLKEQLLGCGKVVLLNSNFWSDSEQKKKDRVRIADIAFKAKRILIQESIPNLFGNPTDFQIEIEKLKSEAIQMSSESIAYASLAMRERDDFSDSLRLNKDDYFIIHGVNDRLVQTEEIQSKLGDTKQLFLIENAGHMVHIENPIVLLRIFENVFI